MNDISFYCIQIGMFLLGFASCWLVDAIRKGRDIKSFHVEDDLPKLFKKGDDEDKPDPDDFDGALIPIEFQYDRD